MNAVEWAKVVAPVAIAAITAYGTSVQMNQGQVGRQRFIDTTTENCQEINDLKAGIRQFFVDNQELIEAGLVVDALQTFPETDCSLRSE